MPHPTVVVSLKNMDETQNANSWPKKIGLAFLGFVVFGGFFFLDNRKALLDAAVDLKNNWRLAPYEKQVQECLVKARERTAGQKVVGLEFSCAIQIGREFYAKDPELAMELCRRHSLIKNPEFDTSTRQTCRHEMSETVEQETSNTPATTTPRTITPTTTIEVLKGALSPTEPENVILR